MELGDELFRVRSLSDDALLLGLTRSLRASRRAVAEIVAHLGEVEERRLHLLGGYSSMFAYCIRRLGMSEDEAYRRLEVALLVRRFPRLLEMLAAGQVSLSVAALLKARLSDENHEALLAAVSCKTVAQAREVLAAWFPQPDVLPLLRKLPTRAAPLAAVAGSTQGVKPQPEVAGVAKAPGPDVVSAPAPPATQATQQAQPGPPVQSKPRRSGPTPERASLSRDLEPLSPDRYKLQLTVSSEVKRKLELARDLLRHAVPSGDLATLVERALDLLLERTIKRRFGAKRTAVADSGASKKESPGELRCADQETEPGPALIAPTPLPPTSSESPAASLPATRLDAAAPVAGAAARTTREVPARACSAAVPSGASRRVPNATRRAVLERDGLRCTWEGPDGTRCNSRAWLEHDHIIPHGKGGTNDAVNGRNLCRPHNRLSAELAYGRDTITRIIAHRQSGHAPADNEPTRSATELKSKTPDSPQ